jgi:hypothetical protein
LLEAGGVSSTDQRPGERIVAIEWRSSGRNGVGTAVFLMNDGSQDRKVMDLATVKGLVKIIFEGRHREFPVESPRDAIRWERDGDPPDPSVVPAIPR